MIRQLQPNSTTSRKEQYDLAWNALLNSPEKFNPQQRAHAKCWLTYRAVDGEVPFTDWLMKIDPEVIPPVHEAKTALRWKLSQLTAEVYLMILNRQEWYRHGGGMIAYMHAGAMREYPGTSTNCLRIAALVAYNAFLHSEAAAVEIAVGAMENWRDSWASFDIRENPLRFAELPADAAPLHVLMSIYRQDMAPRAWADKLILDSANSVWGKCMKEITLNPRRLW